MSTRITLAVPSALLLLGLGSCTSSRFYEHRFVPAPLEAQVGSQAVEGSQVRSLLTVIGIERAGEGHGPRAVVRMRLENLGTVPAKLDQESLSLVSADLAEFGPVQVVPGDPEPAPEGEIGAGQTASFDLLFPLPEGKGPAQMDLTGLNLRFTLRFGDQPVTTGATFQRVEWWYADPYPHVSIGVGFTSDG